VLGAALLAGVEVVRNAAVVQYAETKPELAARIWPSHPASKLWVGLTEIGLSARNKAPVAASTFDLIRDAARKEPLAPEPFLVRGVQAQLAGDQQVAERAFVAAKLRDGRSIPARYFLAEQYFRSGDAPSGLREIAVLARMVPNGVTSLAPYVAAYAKDPRNRTQLQSLFKSDPTLEQAALSTLAVDPGNADLILSLASPSAAVPQWSGVLIPTLVNARQYGEAYRVWARMAHVHPPADGTVFDARFAGSDAPPPFNWSLTSSTVGLAEGQPGGRLHAIFYGQEDGVLARQLLLLKPGRYRLAMRISGEPSRAAALSWTLTCADSKVQLISLLLSDSKKAASGVSFEVPANCAAQSLELTASAPEVAQQADVTISDFSLKREQSGG
jgi:hypothetical protein